MSKKIAKRIEIISTKKRFINKKLKKIIYKSEREREKKRVIYIDIEPETGRH